MAFLAWRGSTGASTAVRRRGVRSLRLHPLALLFALHGSLMISKTLRIPKP